MKYNGVIIVDFKVASKVIVRDFSLRSPKLRSTL